MCSRLRSLSLALVVLFLALPARADATVIVELKRADGASAEGTVQLTRGELKHRCTTDKAGRCALPGVAGGVYTVSVEQAGGRPAPKEKTVVIPPSGEVKLIVNAS